MNENFLTMPNGRKLRLNTPEEDAAITKSALADPDARPLTDEEWEAVKPKAKFGNPFGRSFGRPKAETTKVFTSIRLDADLLATFKSGGKGWQTRINAALREWVAQHPA